MKCQICTAEFSVSPEEQKICDERKFAVQPFCFLCRQKHRLSFRNGRKLYRRTCDLTGKQIISMYSQEKPYKVYAQEVWWGEGWDPLSYGRPFDFNRPFFEQFRELQRAVPRLALTNIRPENSDYCNMCEGNKNSYLVFGGDFNEDTMYGTLCMRNRSTLDCDYSNDNEQCCELGASFNCYNSRFAFDSKNCSDCAFISDCIGCTDCILCTNLGKRSHCIRNEQLTKDEYERQKKLLLNGTASQQRSNWQEFVTLLGKRIVKSTHILNSENCAGDYIVNSKNCRNCFDVWDCEDLKDVLLATGIKNGVNSGFIGHRSELCYNMMSGVVVYDCTHSFSIFDSNSVDYSDLIANSKNIFGCTGLKKHQYCILNKQYSEKEYNALREKIIEHMQKTPLRSSGASAGQASEWGQFFPKDLSCFGYNETTAYEYFPLEQSQAIAEGFQWSTSEDEPLAVEKVIPAAKLPDNIDDIPDDVLNWAITCDVSKKSFRINKQELQFYRQHRMPIPREHPDVRYARRLSLKNPKQLWSRTCGKCGKGIETTYAQERPETVYCEKCYLDTVY